MKVRVGVIAACLACFGLGYGIAWWNSAPKTLTEAGVYVGAKAVGVVTDAIDCHKQIEEATAKAEKEAAEKRIELLDEAVANAEKAQARLQNEKRDLSIELTNLYTLHNNREQVEGLCKINSDHAVYDADSRVRRHAASDGRRSS